MWASNRGMQLSTPKGGYKEPLILLKVDPIWLEELGCTRYGHAIYKPKRKAKAKVSEDPPFDPPYTVVSEREQVHVSMISLHDACSVVA